MFFTKQKSFSDLHFWTFLKMSNSHFLRKVFSCKNTLFQFKALCSKSCFTGFILTAYFFFILLFKTNLGFFLLS